MRKRGGEGVRDKHATQMAQAARRTLATSLALVSQIQREAAERPNSPAAREQHSTFAARKHLERNAIGRSGAMSCSGVPHQAAHAERKHSTLDSVRPRNAPADSHLRATLIREDATSCDDTPRQQRYHARSPTHNRCLRSIQSRRERPHHATPKVSGHQPNARHHPPRTQCNKHSS